MKHLFVFAILAISLYACNNSSAPEQSTDAAAEEASTPAPAEFADAKYIEVGKNGLASLASKDIATWMNNFSDNAVYVWNNGDSLVGKPAIQDYWTKRMADVITEISFANDLWLPVKINQPQSVEAPGVWLLGWYQVTAKYSTGKTMTQWIHTAQHFDANDKIDRVIQYLDRASINAAMTK